MLANNKPAQIVEVPASFWRIFPLHRQHWAVNRFPLPVISVAEPPLFEAAPALALEVQGPGADSGSWAALKIDALGCSGSTTLPVILLENATAAGIDRFTSLAAGSCYCGLDCHPNVALVVCQLPALQTIGQQLEKSYFEVFPFNIFTTEVFRIWICTQLTSWIWIWIRIRNPS